MQLSYIIEQNIQKLWAVNPHTAIVVLTIQYVINTKTLNKKCVSWKNANLSVLIFTYDSEHV